MALVFQWALPVMWVVVLLGSVVALFLEDRVHHGGAESTEEEDE